VKLTRAQDGRFLFRLSRKEKEVLLPLLRRYPVLPAGYQKLSKAAGVGESSQQLLEEALEEQRQQHRRQLDAMLQDKTRLRRVEQGWALSLSEPELEWLLQVLNDIRVGSWVRLGSPETLFTQLTEENVHDVYAMEVAGAFQASILDALEQGA
jgi:hypothetical protein